MSEDHRTVWVPSTGDRAAANVTSFMDWLDREERLRFASYDELWQWSVVELESFWEAMISSSSHAPRMAVRDWLARWRRSSRETPVSTGKS